MNDQIEKVLNLSFYKGKDLYSDGDIEDELLNIVQNNDDYMGILKMITDGRFCIIFRLYEKICLNGTTMIKMALY